MDFFNVGAEVASCLMRIAAYVFLRWIPGHIFLPIILSLFAVYATLFALSFPNGRVTSPAWRSLLLGGKSASPAVSTTSFLTNLVLALMSADMIYRPYHMHPESNLSFVRIGYVSDSQANFLVREPSQARLPLSLKLCVLDEPDDCQTFTTGSGQPMRPNDFTTIITARFWNKDKTTYSWHSSNGFEGTVKSAPPAGTLPASGNFTFLSTSCIINNFPYNPLHHPLNIPGMSYLVELLPKFHAQFMLFLGDFIYIDVPHRFGSKVEDYRRKYRQAYAAPQMPAVMKNLSWLHVLDDHEISNDWDSGFTGVYKRATEPFDKYHAAVNPPPVGGSKIQEGPKWYEFTQGPATFFMLDTRSFRSRNKQKDDVHKSMLGATQLRDFVQWIERDEPRGVRWKIVASSVPFTKNWPVNRDDTWGGFLTERRKVLEAMWKTSAKGYRFVVLSGDRHEFAATAFPPPANSTAYSDDSTIYEFSTSPLSQFSSPYPTYKQTDEEDVALMYIPFGLSKFGVFTITNGQDVDESLLHFQVYVNGNKQWEKVISAPHRPYVEEIEEIEEVVDSESEEQAQPPKGLLGKLGSLFWNR